MKDRKNNIIILFALTVVCLILIVASTLKDSWMTPIKTGVGYILTPIQSAVNKVGEGLIDKISENRNIDELLIENENYKNTVDDLLRENTRLQQDNYELERLRGLYQLDQEYGKYEKIGARVIAKDSVGWFNLFKIDKGSDDGLAVDMNVIAGQGLVGIITEVGPNYATVRSIIDDSSRVSAMSMESGDEAIVAGSLESFDTGRLILQDIRESSDIKDGDKIVTSNISTKFLPGILIGYAAEIKTDANRLTKSGYLIPVADFNNIREVLVITTLKDNYEENDS